MSSFVAESQHGVYIIELGNIWRILRTLPSRQVLNTVRLGKEKERLGKCWGGKNLEYTAAFPKL